MKEGFFWGNSVSSMQTEGGWNEDGKSLSVYDIIEPAEHRSDWHTANDNYHHFEEDMDLMQDLGMNMYRFQVSWSRCVKDGTGAFNEAGFAYYDRFIDALAARGITPMICLYHFDMPLALAEEENGFLSRKTVDAFLRFAYEVIDRFHHKVHWWITFNEQNLYCQPRTAFRISGYTRGNKTIEELYRIAANVMYAHCAVCDYIHAHTDGKIGGMLAYSEVYPHTCHPKDILTASAWDEFINTDLLDTFAFGRRSPMVEHFIHTHGIDTGLSKEDMQVIQNHTEDFLSFSYYASNTISAEKIPDDAPVNDWLEHGTLNNPYIKATEWNWQIDPDGFRDVLNKMYRRYRMPVFPIENGIGVQEEWDGIHPINDDYRIEYHRDHIAAMKKAVEEDGVEVLGYLGWGLIDILSSQGDMRKRYGVVYVNRTNHDLRDMKRVPKKSYAWLKQVIHSNGEIL